MPNSMPPFSRLIASWSVLVVIVACVLQNGIIQLVYSDLAVGYNIELGNLTSVVAEASAVAKLSNGPHQQGWWKLTNAHWHDSAIQRFFAEGPLRAVQMRQLANANGKPDSWHASKIVNIGRTTDFMVALQNLSTATYQMSRSITGTGKIDASMWTLLFRCIGTRSCNEGYFVPIVSVPHEQAADHYSYATLWLHLTTNLLVNAIPSFIAKLPPARPVTVDVDDAERISIVVNVHDNVSECPSSVVLGYRSLLDASYGLVPGSACIKIGGDDPFTLLVFLVQLFDNATEPKVNNLTTHEEFFSLLQIHTGQWKQLQFEDCSDAVVLIRVSQNPMSLTLCFHEICLKDYVWNTMSCSGAEQNQGSAMDRGVRHLRSLHSITTLSKSCTYDGGKPLPPSNNDTAPTEVSCKMSSAEVCNETVDVVHIESAYKINPLRLLSPQSSWSSYTGNTTSEFGQAPHMTDFNANHACIRKVSPQVLSNTDQAALLEAIQIRARAYLNSLIAEHNIAFMTTKGPATDLQNFLALIVSTAISVIMAIAGPFTDFLLRIICRRWPHHLDSQRMGRVHKAVKVWFLMMCNVLLSICSYLPVVYMAWSEGDREKRFDTWDLASNDQFIYNSFGSEQQLRVVYLFSATSKYESHFIIASTLVVCITCVIAGVCSARRCKEVFDRHTLLQKYDPILAADNIGPVMRADKDTETLIFARALKAINMTEAEYLEMKEEVRMQELAQTATKPQLSVFSPAKTGRVIHPASRLTGIVDSISVSPVSAMLRHSWSATRRDHSC